MQALHSILAQLHSGINSSARSAFNQKNYLIFCSNMNVMDSLAYSTHSLVLAHSSCLAHCGLPTLPVLCPLPPPTPHFGLPTQHRAASLALAAAQ